jgi:hypothetical protein
MKNKKIIILTAAFMLPIATLLTTKKSEAVAPKLAKITQIVGQHSINLRRKRGITPVAVGAIMRWEEKLMIQPYKGNTYAKLEFYDAKNKSLNLEVQAAVENNLRTDYYMPCGVEKPDSFIINWVNPKTQRGACKQGIKIKSGRGKRSDNNFSDIIASINPLIGQRKIYQWRYCSVVDEVGKGWLGLKSRRTNLCNTPLKQCEEEGEGTCTELTTDDWNTDDSNMVASIECDNNQKFVTTGTGEDIKEKAEKLWEEAATQGAKFCGFHVFSQDEIIAIPTSVEEETIVKIGEIDACLKFKVRSGEVTLNSLKHPQGIVIKKGKEYEYCTENQAESISNVDLTEESIAMQIFMAKERGYQFCNALQDSGGQEGSKRTIQLTANKGTIEIDYNMYGIPDSLIVTYEGKELVRRENVSNSDSLSIPFEGKSGQVTVEIVGNEDNSGTKWEYNLKCPQ